MAIIQVLQRASIEMPIGCNKKYSIKLNYIRMAKIVNNDKGFKVISLSTEDAASLGFGIDGSGTCICMHCNKGCLSGDIYYIAVLNDTMCKNCYERWIKSATRYAEDIPIENRNFNHYKEWLCL